MHPWKYGSIWIDHELEPGQGLLLLYPTMLPSEFGFPRLRLFFPTGPSGFQPFSMDPRDGKPFANQNRGIPQFGQVPFNLSLQPSKESYPPKQWDTSSSQLGDRLQDMAAVHASAVEAQHLPKDRRCIKTNVCTGLILLGGGVHSGHPQKSPQKSCTLVQPPPIWQTRSKL